MICLVDVMLLKFILWLSSQQFYHNHRIQKTVKRNLFTVLLFFLSFISLLGKITNSFISDTAIKGLNIIVGIVLIYFAIKLLMKKDNKENEELK